MLIFALNLKEEKEMKDNFVNACEDLFYGKVENYIFDSNSEMAAVCKGKAMRYIKKWLKSNEILTKTFGDFLLKIFKLINFFNFTIIKFNKFNRACVPTHAHRIVCVLPSASPL